MDIFSGQDGFSDEVFDGGLEDVIDDAHKRRLGELVTKQALTDTKKFLSPEELEAYRQAQQSIIDARESAIRNEGQNIIL